MKKYKEWDHINLVEDRENPYSSKFVYPNGDVFYIEPVFYLKFEGFKQQHPDSINLILERMEKIVKENHIVVFAGEEDYEITKVNGAIYLVIQDITDPLCIFVEDKSRGSDYGD